MSSDPDTDNDYPLGWNRTSDTSLSKLVEANLVASRPRFVCGPGNDRDRIFYTFDALTGDLLASSLPYTYHGIPMRRIPGTDDFVTVTVDSSRSKGGNPGGPHPGHAIELVPYE